MKNRTHTPLVIKKKRLADGESMVLPPISAKTEKHLVFTCTVKTPFRGKITVGHGKDITATSWLEIGESALSAFSCYCYKPVPLEPIFDAPVPHGLAIRGTLRVALDIDPLTDTFALCISTENGSFSREVRGWDGCNGEIFASVEGAELWDCTLTWDTGGLDRDIWVLGDSYIGLASNRWPYYLLRDGYKDVYLQGFPGMGSAPAIAQLETVVERACPKIAFFALGMNDGDKDGAIHPAYLASAERFLEICKEKGITPVLATIPNTPKVDNRYKNAWVRAQGVRTVDFASAVGAAEGTEWYEGMLCEDLVHPADAGAVALYRQLLIDLPEIKGEKRREKMKNARDLFQGVLKEKKNIKIKLLGDSITHGVGGSGWAMVGEPIVEDFKRSPDSFCWAKLFSERMKEKYGATVVNNGCTGTTVEFIVKHFDALVSETDDIVICTIGTNNRHFYKENGERPSREAWGRVFLDGVMALHALFEKKGVKVIFVANLPAAAENEQDGDNYYRVLHMDDINAIYKHAARKAGFALISMYDLVSEYVKEKNILVDALLCDGLHPSDEGYRVMFSLLCEALAV